MTCKSVWAGFLLGCYCWFYVHVHVSPCTTCMEHVTDNKQITIQINNKIFIHSFNSKAFTLLVVWVSFQPPLRWTLNGQKCPCTMINPTLPSEPAPKSIFVVGLALWTARFQDINFQQLVWAPYPIFSVSGWSAETLWGVWKGVKFSRIHVVLYQFYAIFINRVRRLKAKVSLGILQLLPWYVL